MANEIKIAPASEIADASLVSRNILPPSLAGYRAEENIFDGAFSFTGGFCISIKIIKPGAPDKCIRCWHNPEVKYMPELLSEMRNVANGLKARNANLKSYFANFQVVDNLINVGHYGTLPGIVMDWLKGETLQDYVVKDSGHTGPQILKVAEMFREMCHALWGASVSHGDLSSSNIMVKPNDSGILLIDYDSLYFKEMGVRKEVITGAEGYQHFDRKKHGRKETYSDNFSQHIIYTAMLVYGHSPALRPTDNSNKHLYFEKEDVASANAFYNSPRVKAARALGIPEINAELDLILKALRGSYPDIPPLKKAFQKPRQANSGTPQNKKPKQWRQTAPAQQSRFREREKPKPANAPRTPAGNTSSSNVPRTPAGNTSSANAARTPVQAPAPKRYQVRYCTNCGAEFNNPEHKFCSYCGHKRHIFTM